ncbi:MAG: zinc ABC transporter substrate-binding protein [Alphaproteobacteria bacterium]
MASMACFRRWCHPLVLVLVLALALVSPTAMAMTVVTSIGPVHSLVSGVMEGAGTPVLLLRGGVSPHTYSLRPSDARALNEARLVFWVGPELEGFLARPLAGLGGGTTVVELMNLPGLTLHPARPVDSWEEGHDHGGMDPHLWLDPDNARRIVAAAAEALAAADSGHADLYRANAGRLLERLDALDREVRDLLTPVRERGFIVFHDAYQYLERRYGLRAVGAVTVSPERPPGARRLSDLRRRLMTSGIVCVFQEPQFPPKLFQTLTEGTPARTGILDPNGAAVASGSDQYFEMMRSNARSLRTCLGGP